MILAVDLTELAGDEHVIAICGYGVDEVVDVGAKARIESARVRVVRGDVGLIHRCASRVLDLGERSDDDDAVPNHDAVEHLAVDYTHGVRARRVGHASFGDTGLCLRGKR